MVALQGKEGIRPDLMNAGSTNLQEASVSGWYVSGMVPVTKAAEPRREWWAAKLGWWLAI